MLKGYAVHDTLSGVKVSNEPVRRNQRVKDKFALARMWMKEAEMKFGGHEQKMNIRLICG